MQVVKRDGRKVEFDSSKIESAIKKAFIESNEEYDHNLALKSISRIDDSMTVEQIQDIVVKVLQSSKFKKTAECYIKYRYKRELDRKGFKSLDKRFQDIIFNGDNENANKPSHLLNVKRDLIAGEYFRYRTEQILPKHLMEAHINKTIHIHDTDFLGDVRVTNCCVFDLEDMLKNGTRVNNADIGEPNSIGVACTVATQIIANIAFQQYGGISVTNFNEIMAYYAKKDFEREYKYICDILNIEYPTTIGSGVVYEDLVYDNIKNKTKDKVSKLIENSTQTVEYQLNSISSSSQTPFSTLSFNIPTSWESEQVTLKYFKVRRDGLGFKEKRTAIFPKLSLFVVDGYNLKEGDPYFHIVQDASKTIAKCFYPDILHYSKEDYNKGMYYSRMGCRSKVNQDFVDSNGNYSQSKRFNWGVHTLSLGHIALQSLRDGGTEEVFFNHLDSSIKLMEEAILFRFNHMKDMKAKESPILFMYGGLARLNPDDSIEHLLRSDISSVSFGYMGIDDATRILLGETIKDKKGREFGLKLMKTLRDSADDMKKRLNLPISVYPSPIESLIYKTFKTDIKNYSDVMPQWLKERGYYTNSYHYSSELPIDAFDKLKIESEYVKYNNGANINYSEIGLVKNNPNTIIELIQYGHELGIEYQGFNVRNDKCFKCEHEGEMIYDDKNNTYRCPVCGNDDQSSMSVISRLCGYLGNLEERKSSKGRMLEIKNRAVHV